MYKEEDCLMYYRYKKNEDFTEAPEKVFVAPNLVLLMLLEKLKLELAEDEKGKPIIK